jgi:hypothetical protein
MNMFDGFGQAGREGVQAAGKPWGCVSPRLWPSMLKPVFNKKMKNITTDIKPHLQEAWVGEEEL